eukprot:g13941.t1
MSCTCQSRKIQVPQTKVNADSMGGGSPSDVAPSEYEAPGGHGGQDGSSQAAVFFGPVDKDWPWLLLFSIMLVILSIMFEVMGSAVESKVHGNRSAMAMVDKIYAEFTFLGVFSFVLTLHRLEFAHFWLFLSSAFCVLGGAAKVFAMKATNANWERIEALPNESLYLAAQKVYSPSWWTLIAGRGEPAEETQFHVAKAIMYRLLRMDPDVQFSVYLKKCISQDIIHSLHIYPSSWFSVFCLVTLFALVPRSSFQAAAQLSVGLSLALLLLDALVLIYMRWTTNRFMQLARQSFLLPHDCSMTQLLTRALDCSTWKLSKEERERIAPSSPRTITSPRARRQSTASNASESFREEQFLALQGLFPFDNPTIEDRLLQALSTMHFFLLGLQCMFWRPLAKTYHESIAAAFLFAMLALHLAGLLLDARSSKHFIFVRNTTDANKEILQTLHRKVRAAKVSLIALNALCRRTFRSKEELTEALGLSSQAAIQAPSIEPVSEKILSTETVSQILQRLTEHFPEDERDVLDLRNISTMLRLLHPATATGRAGAITASELLTKLFYGIYHHRSRARTQPPETKHDVSLAHELVTSRPSALSSQPESKYEMAAALPAAPERPRPQSVFEHQPETTAPRRLDCSLSTEGKPSKAEANASTPCASAECGPLVVSSERRHSEERGPEAVASPPRSTGPVNEAQREREVLPAPRFAGPASKHEATTNPRLSASGRRHEVVTAPLQTVSGLFVSSASRSVHDKQAVRDFDYSTLKIDVAGPAALRFDVSASPLSISS